ncbi:amidohydrolase [Clostridium sp. AWRP]|uniref:amidohydrolase n=1 Tax=Clostridium sp. AWRP TaxID=2212991 RepID=UPI000FD736F4|nr:amidohydrolase [Clostridium sp. AWRP]AZV57680.1 amidohydrolase [Clostridium sp. AWRP]
MNKADVVLKSNHIFTGTSKEVMEGIVAVKDNKIIYVGSASYLDELTDEHTKIYDYGDQIIIPGFHDAHVHTLMSALMFDKKILPIEGFSEQECVDAIGDFADRFGEDEWVITTGWYLPVWENKVLPTKASLDAVYPNRPVAMLSGDCHALWLNSTGLKKLGITEESTPPVGGKYGKDEQGHLTGVFFETAAFSATSEILESNDDCLLNAYIKFQNHLAENGITSICDVSMMPVEGRDQLKDDIYQKLLDEDLLKVRVNMFPTITKNLERPLKMRENYKGTMLKFGGTKQFFDGVSSTHTAYLSEPYSNAYFEGDNGRTTIDPKDMEDLIMSAVENDMSIRIHTIGDGAIHLALGSFEKAEKKYGRKPNLQHTLEHLENIQKEDIKRLADLHVIASMQPGHCLIDPAGIEKDLGLERSKLMWTFRDMLDSNVTLAFGTDSPIIDTIPLLTIYYAVTRENVQGEPEGGWEPHQKISVEEALIAHTYGSACAAGRGNELGTLEKGKLADITVIDRDVVNLSPKELLNAKICFTMTNGKVVYKTE